MDERIELVDADITTLEVDAIVNAANNSLLGGGGVDGAIHRAAGPGLLEECRRLNGCDTGDAKITGGHNLPAHYVIHTVGPVWRSGTAGEEELLTSCYVQCYRIAREYNLRTVAFPAISTGVYGFPKTKAALIAVRQTRNGLAANDKLQKVYFVCFNRDTRKAYEEALRQ
ncbi:MAG: O-acetyl-ADP-ribose deacetylase [Desulfobulbales bacterium]